MKLPITRPSIISYLHYAHDLSIVETDKRAKEYLAVSFLHLLTTLDVLGQNIMLDFCTKAEGYPMCPFLSNELLTGDDIAVFGKTAVDKACSLLQAGYYVRVDLNEFYVSESMTYQVRGENLETRPKRLRPIHFNLIYGYDETRSTFLTHGFDKQLRFKEREISFEEFELAYYGDDVGMRRLRLLSEQECSARMYDQDKVIQALTDFVASQCSYLGQKQATKWTKIRETLRPHTSVLGMQFRGPSFGMAVYDVAVRMVERYNGKLIDIRPWCVIHDQKRSMLRLCDYLMQDHGFSIAPGLLADLKQIEDDFFSVRNYLLESQITDRHVKPSALKNNLDRLKEAESAAIGELIQTMRG
jgi:hypothetical protein